MSEDKMDLKMLESICREVISLVILTCELELIKHNDEIKGLPSAALAVKESILTFLALVNPK